MDQFNEMQTMADAWNRRKKPRVANENMACINIKWNSSVGLVNSRAEHTAKPEYRMSGLCCVRFETMNIECQGKCDAMRIQKANATTHWLLDMSCLVHTLTQHTFYSIKLRQQKKKEKGVRWSCIMYKIGRIHVNRDTEEQVLCIFWRFIRPFAFPMNYMSPLKRMQIANTPHTHTRALVEHFKPIVNKIAQVHAHELQK